MVRPEITLKEFIQVIPVCDLAQGEACYDRNYKRKDLVSAMGQSSRGIVALIDSYGIPQGIIKNNDLLWIMSKNFIAISSNVKKAQVQINELRNITISLISLPSQMKVKVFLQRFASQSRSQDYFIVDAENKLLGILDTNKLLQTIAYYTAKQGKVKSNLLQQDVVSNEGVTEEIIRASEVCSDVYSKLKPKKGTKAFKKQLKKNGQIELKFQEEHTSLFSLLNQISLPLSIENFNGEICYQNEYWQQELSQGKSFLKSAIDNECSESNSQLYMRKQVFSNLKCDLFFQENNLSNLDSQSSLKLARKIDRIDSDLSKCSVNKRAVNNSLLERTDTEKDVNKSSFWYHYRIPLNIKGNSPALNDNHNYWLILAVPFSLQQFLLTDCVSGNNGDRRKKDKFKLLQDKFLLNIGHDLKSPLTAIIGLSDLLKAEKLGTLNQKQISYIEMIYNSGKRLVNLTNDFLDFTHLTSKKLQFNFKSLELKDTCKQIYRQVEQKLTTTAKSKDVNHFPELKLNIAPDTQVAIADEIYLNQILTILLENALHLTNYEGSLGITSQLYSQWLAITIWNQEGALTQEQQYIFAEEFFQYLNVLTSQEKNQSLKLILAQQLAQAHGGDISFVSQKDRGSEFTLLLPLNPNDLQQDIDRGSDIIGNNSLVLIIETASNRISDLSQKLKTLGYFSAIARSDSEALYKARVFKPSKILLNCSFLDEKLDIVTTLKLDLHTRNIPLLITTDTSSSIASLDNIADEVLSFPISRNTLARYFTPLVSHQSIEQNLTVLRLSLVEDTIQARENSILDFVFENSAFSLSHHIIEADSIEQAHLLARIWTIDVVIWDGTTSESPEAYLHSFAKFKALASIPLITLDAKTTSAANKISNLAIFPCLLPANERSIQQLTQVIQIAAGIS